jgi:RES domain-containing protein
LTLWRVSNHRTLDGRGGLHASARWHTRGYRIVYCATTPAAALLEVLVHTEVDAADIPVSMRYLQINVPDSLAPERADMEALGQGWNEDEDITRWYGDAWLRSRRSALLEVPSAIVPETWNVLINPLHPDSAAIRLVKVHEQSVDSRLLSY